MRPLTVKQEAVAVAVASGMPPRDALMKVYNWKGSAQNAHVEALRLTAKPNVAARIKELRDQYATKVIEASRGKPAETPARAYGVAEAMQELDEAFTTARDKENPGAMAKVVEVRMKLYGLGIADSKNPADKEALPPEELEAALEQLKAMRASMTGAGRAH